MFDAMRYKLCATNAQKNKITHYFVERDNKI